MNFTWPPIGQPTWSMGLSMGFTHPVTHQFDPWFVFLVWALALILIGLILGLS